MPRPRTPTEVLEISGAFDDQPGRRRPPALGSLDPIGDPPAWMDPEAATYWREVVSEAAPGVLTAADRGVVEILAHLRAKTRRCEASTAETGLMLRGLIECFLTPASRSKVAPVGPDKLAGATPWGFLRK
jgi:hypothetical protein